MPSEEARNAIKHFVADHTLDRTKSYLDRGRHLEGLSNAKLRQFYLTAVRREADNPDDLASAQDSADAQSEHELRGIEPPYALVDLEIRLIAARAAIDLMRLDPEDMKEIGAKIVQSGGRHKREKN